MGYYSSVGISMRKSDYIEMCRRARQENRDALDLITKHADIYLSNAIYDREELQQISLYYPSIKWYDSFHDINWVEDYIINKTKHGAVKIEIGEEIADNEEYHYEGTEDSDAIDEAWDSMQFVRDINFSGTVINYSEMHFEDSVTANIDELI